VIVGGGVEFSELVNFCIQNALSGLEWAGGLPGTVGGAIRGNAGAYLGETKDNVLEVTSIGLETSVKKTRTRDECLFDYRASIFKTRDNKDVIVSAKFVFKKGEKAEIAKVTREKIDHRNLRHPLEYPNIGSTFKNIPVDRFSSEQLKEFAQFIKDDPFPVVPAGKLIFLAGLKGQRVGDIMVSEKHTNFLVNLGDGRAADVRRLIDIINKSVKDKFGVALEEEIMYVD
jgi:UDP-N-acetylmuramate dehydrogenase